MRSRFAGMHLAPAMKMRKASRPLRNTSKTDYLPRKRQRISLLERVFRDERADCTSVSQTRQCNGGGTGSEANRNACQPSSRRPLFRHTSSRPAVHDWTTARSRSWRGRFLLSPANADLSTSVHNHKRAADHSTGKQTAYRPSRSASETETPYPLASLDGNWHVRHVRWVDTLDHAEYVVDEPAEHMELRLSQNLPD